MTIHDELRRIADRAPAVTVPSDTWARARRARRRAHAVAIAGVLAVGLLLVGAVAWLPGQIDPPVADTREVGVPDHLYAVPEWMSDRENDGSWMRDEVTDDPTTVGVGAAAWVTSGGLPVVVGAADGAYHLLDLPDFAGNNETFTRGLGTPTLALSPDGRRLAYGYAVFGPTAATEPIPSGVRVVDLTTGARREIPVPGEEGTAVGRIEWSPDGRWLAFAGLRQGTWTRYSMGTSGSGGAVLGRIPPGADRAEVRSISNDQVPLSVADDGTVQWRDGELRVWGQGTPDRRDLSSLGRLSDGSRLVRVGTPNADALAVRPRHGGRRIAIRLDGGIDGSLSIATDLMPPSHLTVSRPAPDWPWTDERRAVVIGGAVALALLAAGWVVLRRRRR